MTSLSRYHVKPPFFATCSLLWHGFLGPGTRILVYWDTRPHFVSPLRLRVSLCLLRAVFRHYLVPLLGLSPSVLVWSSVSWFLRKLEATPSCQVDLLFLSSVLLRSLEFHCPEFPMPFRYRALPGDEARLRLSSRDSVLFLICSSYISARCDLWSPPLHIFGLRGHSPASSIPSLFWQCSCSRERFFEDQPLPPVCCSGDRPRFRCQVSGSTFFALSFPSPFVTFFGTVIGPPFRQSQLHRTYLAIHAASVAAIFSAVFRG